MAYHQGDWVEHTHRSRIHPGYDGQERMVRQQDVFEL